MDLYIRHGERVEKVAVEREGDAYVVAIGETAPREVRVDAVRLSSGLWSLSSLDGELRPQREVAVRTGADGKTRVSSANDAWDLEVSDPLTHLAEAANEAGAASGRRRRQKVTALMPGRVVAVLAEAGQTVEAGQGIVVVEAMKMQNEILADHEGTLKAVFVTPGQPVERGDPLFELE